MASDLAEEEICANIAGMMILDATKKAKAIRELAELDRNSNNPACREYQNAQRSIYGAIWNLIDWYKGYKLVKE